MLLNQPATEKFCGFTPRTINTLRSRNILPFMPKREKSHAKRLFNPAEILFLLIQKRVTDEWRLTYAEAAWTIRHLHNGMFENWELATRDGWLVRRKAADGVYHHFLTDQNGVRDFATNTDEDAETFEWSSATLQASSKMREDGASEAEIRKFLLVTEGARLEAWHSSKERKLWILPLNPIFTVMEATAQAMKVPLPPRENRDSWFASNA